MHVLGTHGLPVSTVIREIFVLKKFRMRACVRKLNARKFPSQYKNVHVTTVRGRQYENYLIRKFNVRNFSRAKYLRITVFQIFTSLYSAFTGNT